MSEREKVARAAGVVGAATLLSRILGLVRDQVVAYFFGAGMAADAFFVAFRIPNLLRRLLAEGALTVSFIPIFTEYLRQRGREEAFALARAALTVFSMILALVTILGILLSPWIVRIFAPGFSVDPDKMALTILLTRIMFPYIFLIGLVALAMGVLNSLGRFAGPALAPVALNVAMIGCVYGLSRFFDPPVLALAVGVIMGGVLQFAMQVPYLLKEGRLLGLSFDLAHPALRRIALLMAPATLGAAVYQFTVFINTLLASYLPEGSVSYLYYADRIVQFPLGVFAVAVSTAVLPSMSRQAADKDMEGLRDTMSYSLRLVFFITVPAMTGMIVLAEPIIRVLFQRGQFDPLATRATAAALIAYSVGLWALSAVQILVRVFYSLQDTRTPVRIAVVSLVGNVVLSVALMLPFQHVGLALASSGGSIINFVLLTAALRGKLGRMDGHRIFRSLGRQALWSLAMGAVCWLVIRGAHLLAADSPWLPISALVAAVIAGMAVYLGLASLGGASEMKAIRKMIRRRGSA